MSLRTKIFTVYEKLDTPEPADQAVLVREGFSIGAFLFGGLWLLYRGLWRATLGYAILTAALFYLGERVGLADTTRALGQLFLQLMLGFFAYDLWRASLQRCGYRFTGIVTAETPLNAQRRYYDRMT